MKIALCAIAKNEENYIHEWINYHLKLGFHRIIIYKDNWEYSISRENVEEILCVSSEKIQVEVYNKCISDNKHKFDYIAFMDIDEFLVLHTHSNITDFIKDFEKRCGCVPAISINWVLFGDNNMKFDGKNYSVLNRFTMRKITPHPLVKSIANMKFENLLMHVHSPINYYSVTPDGKVISGSENENGNTNLAQINHYFVKTKEEFKIKMERGRADITEKRKINEFDSHNFNEVEDLSALRFIVN